MTPPSYRVRRTRQEFWTVQRVTTEERDMQLPGERTPDKGIWKVVTLTVKVELEETIAGIHRQGDTFAVMAFEHSTLPGAESQFLEPFESCSTFDDAVRAAVRLA